MGGVWEHYGALWVVCGSIMEHYGWCVGALWVVCGSIRERNYRLKKKNYLSGPTQHTHVEHYFASSKRYMKVGNGHHLHKCNKMADTMLNCLTCCSSAFTERFEKKS